MPASWFMCGAFGALALLVTSTSRAEPYRHDGVYLQLTTGIGHPFFSSSATDTSTDPAGHFQGSTDGWSLSGSVLIGGSLSSGLALGAGALNVLAADSRPSRELDGQPIYDDSGGPYIQSFAMIGPFVDYYPSARLGWHVQGMVGYGAQGSADFRESTSPTGIGLMGGVGCDQWVSAEWSIGVLVRVTFASTSLSAYNYTDGLGQKPAEHDIMLAPSVDVSFTYN